MKNKNKLKRIFYLIITVLILISLFLEFFFRVKYVDIKNIKNPYIVNSISKSLYGKNILFLNNQNVLYILKRYYPIADSVSIRKEFPNKLEIYVNNQSILYEYIYKKSKYYVTQSGSYLKYQSNILGNYPIVYSNKPISTYDIKDINTLVNDISKQFVISVYKYEISNDTVYLYINSGKEAIFNFHKSIINQVNELMNVISSVGPSCNIINVEYNKIFCEN